MFVCFVFCAHGARVPPTPLGAGGEWEEEESCGEEEDSGQEVACDLSLDESLQMLTNAVRRRDASTSDSPPDFIIYLFDFFHVYI